MTYCVAISTRAGLVFCSDSRTHAGPDMLSSYSKMHIFHPADGKTFCILSAGNLATTQAIISQIQQDLEDPDKPSLESCEKMIEAARYVAQVSREEQEQARQSTSSSGVDTSASLIFGGQIRGGDHAIYQIYPAGNFITDSDETCYLQIGESKYGKPILDRIINRGTSLEDAARCVIVSMDSTIKSNATVGPPIEVLIYETNSFTTSHYVKFEAEDAYLQEIKHAWDEVLKQGFSSLPRFEWENRTYSPRGEQLQQAAALQGDQDSTQMQMQATSSPGNDYY